MKKFLSLSLVAALAVSAPAFAAPENAQIKAEAKAGAQAPALNKLQPASGGEVKNLSATLKDGKKIEIVGGEAKVGALVNVLGEHDAKTPAPAGTWEVTEVNGEKKALKVTTGADGKITAIN